MNGYPGYSLRDIAVEILQDIGRPATAAEVANRMEDYKYAPSHRQVHDMFRVDDRVKRCRVRGKIMWRMAGDE